MKSHPLESLVPSKVTSVVSHPGLRYSTRNHHFRCIEKQRSRHTSYGHPHPGYSSPHSGYNGGHLKSKKDDANSKDRKNFTWQVTTLPHKDNTTTGRKAEDSGEESWQSYRVPVGFILAMKQRFDPVDFNYRRSHIHRLGR